MTSRQRFLETMRFGRPDRVPLFFEGMRDDVLAGWKKKDLTGPDDLQRMFAYDGREEVPVNLEPLPALERPPASREDLAELRRRLDPADPARLPADWPERVRRWQTRDHVLQLPVHRGFFLSLGVRSWAGFEPAILLLKDRPDLVAEALEIFAEFHCRFAERVLREVQVDCASFSEPIAGNDGPLLSPQDYARLVLPSYRPLLDLLRHERVETVIYVTYANPSPLLPAVVDAGFDCLWACEAPPGTMDYRQLRERFGKALRLIGGIDLDTLTVGEDAIRREIETKVPPLLEQGGYIPLADGRVRASIGFSAYACYRRLLERVAGG